MRHRVITTTAIGVATSILVLATPRALGWWCLALTIAQAAVYFACSGDRPIGWAAGLALQPPWVAYSLLSGQPAFLITSAIMATANLLALRRLGNFAPTATRSGTLEPRGSIGRT